jgi:hypothetical protein
LFQLARPLQCEAPSITLHGTSDTFFSQKQLDSTGNDPLPQSRCDTTALSAHEPLNIGVRGSCSALPHPVPPYTAAFLSLYLSLSLSLPLSLHTQEPVTIDDRRFAKINYQESSLKRWTAWPMASFLRVI